MAQLAKITNRRVNIFANVYRLYNSLILVNNVKTLHYIREYFVDTMVHSDMVEDELHDIIHNEQFKKNKY